LVDWQWKLLDSMNGTLDFRHDRRMTSFADAGGTVLELQTQRSGSGTFGVKVSPEWRVEAQGTVSRLNSPLANAPGYGMNQSMGGLAIKYTGLSRLTAGLVSQYDEDQYRGVPDAARFRQLTEEFSADYVVSGLSTVNLAMGYTNRKSNRNSADDTSGFTGSFGYRRKLTGKTSIEAQAFREATNYVAGANTVIDTGASGAVYWAPTVKTSVDASYRWETSAFQGAPAPGEPQRRDRYQYVRGNFQYRPLPWLTLNPYVEYQDRNSNIDLDSYNALLAGAMIKATLM
jgi:hypothetical protein